MPTKMPTSMTFEPGGMRNARTVGASEARLMELSVQTAEQHLATAKLTHQKIIETISMRTATIASIAGNIIAMGKGGEGKDIEIIAVRIAIKVVEAAEAAESKARELQAAKDGSMVDTQKS